MRALSVLLAFALALLMAGVSLAQRDSVPPRRPAGAITPAERLPERPPAAPSERPPAERPSAERPSVERAPATRLAELPRLAGEAWAVVIGINDYQHERVPKLRYAVADARSMERALVRLGFRADRITTLVDAHATKLREQGLCRPRRSPRLEGQGTWVKPLRVPHAVCHNPQA
jgi:hypothetical protein